jgi:hypothetical protein
MLSKDPRAGLSGYVPPGYVHLADAYQTAMRSWFGDDRSEEVERAMLQRFRDMLYQGAIVAEYICDGRTRKVASTFWAESSGGFALANGFAEPMTLNFSAALIVFPKQTLELALSPDGAEEDGGTETLFSQKVLAIRKQLERVMVADPNGKFPIVEDARDTVRTAIGALYSDRAWDKAWAAWPKTRKRGVGKHGPSGPLKGGQ